MPSLRSCYSTQAAAEEEKYEFQTETAELLNIVAKSLYSENEVCFFHFLQFFNDIFINFK